MQTQPAEILRIHISESDRYQGRPLYEALVEKCRDFKIAGATVFRGVEGYGETAALHKGRLVHGDHPIVLTIVDTADNIARLIPAVSDMIATGLMARSPVEMVRVQKSTTA